MRSTCRLPRIGIPRARDRANKVGADVFSRVGTAGRVRGPPRVARRRGAPPRSRLSDVSSRPVFARRCVRDRRRRLLPPEPQDGSHRLVYVGNLDFFTPPDDVRTGLLGLLGPLASSATAVEVPGWRDLQRPDGTPKPRKRRDAGKHNRGFAVVRFDTVDAGREAALVLDRAELEGRALRSSAGVQTKQMEAAARVSRRGGGLGLGLGSATRARSASGTTRAQSQTEEKEKSTSRRRPGTHAGPSATRASPLGRRGRRVPSRPISGVEVPSLEVPSPVPGLPG